MVAYSHTGKVCNDANETSLHNTDGYTLEADKETGYGDNSPLVRWGLRQDDYGQVKANLSNTASSQPFRAKKQELV